MGISDAKKVCPELILVDGEDLSAFRDVSKKMYGLLKSYSWNKKIERLGLDEYFMDVTDMVDYNVELLNRNALSDSFFCLSRDDPERGFGYDASSVAGCVYGSPTPPNRDDGNFTQYLRLVVASHLARYIRMKIEEQGYTSAAGISTNKLLAKLVGNVNKPRNQTTLLAFRDEQVWSFMDSHALRKVPGIGGRTTSLLESHLSPSLTAGLVRTNPSISPHNLETLLSGPGTEKGIGEKTWHLLHGVDNTPVKNASDIPTQISIEDTYQGLNDLSEITHQLKLLSTSLLRRMHVDLLEDADKRWMAYPKTIRLTTRPKTRDKPYNFARASRSVALPSFVFSLTSSREDIVGRLVDEVLLPMFRRLNPGPRGWNIGLLNVCVANMVVVAGSGDGGRDIGTMFRRQEDVLRQFTVYEEDGAEGVEEVDDYDAMAGEDTLDVVDQSTDDCRPVGEENPEEESDAEPWEEDDRDALETCTTCGHLIPSFALIAHERYHDMEP
jgi:DNA polymerase iota